MSLSFSKLQNFLAEKGYETRICYIFEKTIFLIEVISLKTGVIFFIYIPSKYEIGVDNSTINLKLKPIEFSEDEINMGGDGYIGNIQLHPDKNDDIEEQLEENYKHGIRLTDIVDEDVVEIKSIYKQINRLKFGVENLKYKLALRFKNYLSIIRRDNTINFFTIKKYPRDSDITQLIVVIDLETIYEKSDRIEQDIQTVVIGVQNIMIRNQNLHSTIFQKLSESQKFLIQLSAKLSDKINKLNIQSGKLKDLYEKMARKEREFIQMINDVGNKNTRTSIGNDMDVSQQRLKYEYELQKVRSVKDEISKNLNIVNESLNNTILETDKIMFDNTVMFDIIIRNFEKLKTII